MCFVTGFGLPSDILREETSEAKNDPFDKKKDPPLREALVVLPQHFHAAPHEVDNRRSGHFVA
jgi:hypothetical protein